MIHPRKIFYKFFKISDWGTSSIFSFRYNQIIIVRNKIKKTLQKYKNSWWMNNWIFTYGWNDVWRFETNRRLLSYGRLKNILTKNKFKIKDSCGTPFFL